MSSSTMRIAIAGGTGTLGRPVAAELSERGHEVRVLSRHAPEYQVDLTTGAGLAAALDGCQVVVDASSSPPRTAAAVLVADNRRLLVPLPVPGRVGRALRDGWLTAARPDVRGSITFATWASS